MTNRYGTPPLECECQVCTWCHDAYEHNWYDWSVSIEDWDCKPCQEQFEKWLDISLTSGECEYHDNASGNDCAICKALAFKDAKMIDNSIDNDIDAAKEV